MNIKLRDNTIEFQDGSSLKSIAKSIGDSFSRNVLAAKVDSVLVDLNTTLYKDAEVEFITFKTDEGKKIYRHSAAHILAQAVKRIFPTVRVAIGPAIENGFYYDFDFKTNISQDDLAMIEKEMIKIIKEDIPIVREIKTRKEVLKFFFEYQETYKIELINELPDDAEISMYRQGDFVDLCRGPHVPSTGYIKAIKLTSLTGAYWRGDEQNKMLTRIYGTAFEKKADLEAYLVQLAEAKMRDHNKLGRELGYFMTDECIGQGLPLLMPKGAKLFKILNRFVEDEEERRGYVLTKTPFMAKSKLYKISGHWEHYKDGMFVIGDPKKDQEVFALRPMTCPFQYTIYNNGLKSYRDLPIRYGETSTLFRNESSGEMHGLIRVRQFTISEGHIICMPTQMESEFKGCLDLASYMLKCLGLLEDVSFRFSRWDENDKSKYINDPVAWSHAESEMKKILDNIGLKYIEGIGDAAFYGPKLDIQIKNVHGKEDTIITIQIDMFLSERFDMSYIDENGDKARPYIIHRTSLGCYERTMALLIEKYKGAMPLWFAPDQVLVMSLTDRTAEYTIDVANILKKAGFRVKIDTRCEKIGYKIREGQLEKIPYMLILGDKEKTEKTVSVRSRSAGDLGTLSLDEFISKLNNEIQEKLCRG
ncbi:MAG: threonine--tRNA ligase [Christensenellaceae bacterium]|jgi:threonyl-tRNA synthetase|nr:threonine--tRNA ligase [Christensenellaceae bacterium]